VVLVEVVLAVLAMVVVANRRKVGSTDKVDFVPDGVAAVADVVGNNGLDRIYHDNVEMHLLRVWAPLTPSPL
jgi:hypothetical protein